jgi:hypothetical protein
LKIFRKIIMKGTALPFVPPMPNELIPIKEPSNFCASVTTCRIPDSNGSISGFDFVKFMFGAIIPDSRAKIDLIMLHNPATHSV